MIKTQADLDKAFLTLASAQRTMNRINDRYNAEIEALKKELKAQVDPVMADVSNLEEDITTYAKSVWDNSTREQVFNFGSVKWAKSKGAIEFLKPVEDVIKAIKNLGFTGLIRTKEEVKKEELKGLLTAQPKLSNKLGAHIVVGDPTPTVLVNQNVVVEQEVKG